jgi:hypothetical protein
MNWLEDFLAEPVLNKSRNIAENKMASSSVLLEKIKNK